MYVVNTRAVVDKLHKKRFVLVWFTLTAGLLNIDWVISNVSITLCINLPLCATLYSSGCVNPKHTLPPISDLVPVFVTWNPVTLGFCVLSWQASAWTSPVCLSALLGHLSCLQKIHIYYLHAN